MNLENMLVRDEGREHKAYPDPLTHAEPWTIGIGHTGPEVHKDTAWTDQQIDDAFAADIENARKDCASRLPWFAEFEKTDPPRAAVIVAMAFQMGIKRLLGFAHMLMYCKQGYFAGAAQEMRNSNWAHQTPKRCLRMAQQMESGKWT